MTINISTHKTILFQILKDIYSNTTLAPFLGFKGGTAALMFYGLDRFSVDLDFDLLDGGNEDEVFSTITTILKKYGTLRESYKKRYNLFWLLSYEDQSQNIKVEINRRQFDSEYEIKTYLGVSMLVMKQQDMVAHKLVALSERIGKTSRDIYDVWFFLSHRFPIHTTIVEKRTGVPFKKHVDACIHTLKKMKTSHVLAGLGELLNPKQKIWAKEHLIQETMSLLSLRE